MSPSEIRNAEKEGLRSGAGGAVATVSLGAAQRAAKRDYARRQAGGGGNKTTTTKKCCACPVLVLWISLIGRCPGKGTTVQHRAAWWLLL